MKKMMLAVVAVMALWAPMAAANDVYIAQNASGSGDGASCASAKAVSYFNNSNNWSSTASGMIIGPDTVVHLCGTFTGAAGSTMLTFQGNGTSGHPITLLFENGAVLTAPYWSTSTGAINL